MSIPSSVRFIGRRLLSGAALLAVCFAPSHALAAVTGAGPASSTSPPGQQQATGTVRGSVALEGQGVLPGAVVLVTDTGRSVRTDEEGRFEIRDLAPGTHTLVVSRQGVGSTRETVSVTAGQVTEVDLVVDLEGLAEEVTVTASATGETTAFDAFNAVSTLDSMEMSKDMAGTLGEVLEDEPGLAKRGFGVGSARPIIRGFDGDRVLILDNGIRSGDLSSQSGDHGVTIDPANVDRIEVVRGPATLLYGSNAIGGVINTVTPDEVFRNSPHGGWQVSGTGDAGTANEQLGGNLNFTWADDHWMVYGGGGSRRSDDYDTPAGTVENSATDLSNGRAGFGWFGERAFFSAGYKAESGSFGVPEAGQLHGHGEGESDAGEEVFISLDQQRQALRFDLGLEDVGPWIESARLVLNLIDYEHKEIETFGVEEEVGTSFDNRTYVARAEFDQRRVGELHGKFGAWFQNRDYVAVGEEALAPPVVQNAVAAFAYEEIDFEGWRLQFGVRVEHNDYNPGVRPEVDHGDADADHDHEAEVPDVVARSFTGASASAGARFSLGTGYALVTNFTTSYRAPALEELYNFGPHVGNLTFEIGNPELARERSTGFDVSLRHEGNTVRGSVNLFYYDINDFVFVELEDEFVDGLQEGMFTQADSRFVGIDGSARVQAHRYLIFEGGISWVDAELEDGTPLPRIPPLRGRIVVEIPYRGFRVEPELVLVARQDDVFSNEEPTDGYTVWNLGASYTLVTDRAAHVFSVKGYNLSDELYFNHSSFIDVPEIGRGVKFGYALRLF